MRFGVSPIAWSNDDMPELGADTSLEACLTDVRDVGFDGVELGRKFPRKAESLKPILNRFNLALVGGWHSGHLLVRSANEEIEALQSHMRLLKACGSDVFIFAECSNAVHGNRAIGLSSAPRLGEDQWREFGARLTHVSDYLAGEGFRFAYHHHTGTAVETAADLERFLKVTGSSVGLTLDTGHAFVGGIDCVDVIRRHPERIAHVHCKDVRKEALAKFVREDRSFLDGVLGGMFTVPGDGDIAFAPVFEALADVGYDNWVIVEAEQDPAKADPKTYAEIGFKHVTSGLATAFHTRKLEKSDV